VGRRRWPRCRSKALDPALLLAFDCAGRKGKLKNVADEWAAHPAVTGGDLPILGTYNAGEIGPADITDRTPGVLSYGRRLARHVHGHRLVTSASCGVDGHAPSPAASRRGIRILVWAGGRRKSDSGNEFLARESVRMKQGTPSLFAPLRALCRRCPLPRVTCHLCFCP